MSSIRYAVYLAPGAETPLWRVGSRLLGYDAESGAELEQPVLDGFHPDFIREATEDPRRYGFHMTLKAPFRLAEGRSEAELAAALAAYAGARPGFTVEALVLECRSGAGGRGFLCLVPAVRCEALHALEADIVPWLEPFRAPLSEAERQRRRPEALPARERGYLDRFGYPYILDAYRPHFSLTGALDAPERLAAPLSSVLAAEVGAARFAVEDLVLFRQAGAESRFRILARYPLAG